MTQYHEKAKWKCKKKKKNCNRRIKSNNETREKENTWDRKREITSVKVTNIPRILRAMVNPNVLNPAKISSNKHSLSKAHCYYIIEINILDTERKVGSGTTY